MIPPAIGVFVSFAFIFSLYQGWLPISYDANALVQVLFVIINCIVFAYSLAGSKLSLWHRATGVRKAWMPMYVSRLGFSDTTILIFLVLLKYPYKAFFLLPSYKAAPDGKHILLPELALSSSIQIDESDEARYDVATKTQSVPVKTTGPAKSQGQDRLLLLPAITTPMMLVLVANRYLPVLPFGSVNTANRFEFVDPEACRDPIEHLDLGTKAVATARVGGDSSLGRRVKRGVEFDIVVALKTTRKGETESKIVFRQIITILAFLPKSAKPVFDESSMGAKREEKINWAKEPNSAASFALSSPSKWAAVCSDYNPIHVSSLMAKVFGFASKIAHGNHVVASVLAELQSGTGSSGAGVAERGLKNLLASKQPSFLEVQFKRPMILPTDLVVRYGSSKDLKTYAFSAEKGEKEYVTGRAGIL